MRALVTGADGFAGRWLIAHLEASGDKVWSLGRRGGESSRRVYADIRRPADVERAVVSIRPDAIYHLAAVSYGPDAAKDIEDAVAVTVGGTVNLLSACSRLRKRPTVLIVSSAEVYGGHIDRPLREEDATRPVNAYGSTKLAQEAVGLAYHQAGAVNVAIARAFNHIGPGQRREFVVPTFAAQLARVAAGLSAPVLNVGNLEAVRDFTDVRDVVAAYRLIVTGQHIGRPLNVASGRGIRIRDLLERLVEISNTTVRVHTDPSRLRPVDVPSVVGDAGLLHRLTAWEATMSLDVTLDDVWRDAESAVATEEATTSTQ